MKKNARGAGRKPALSDNQLEQIRAKHQQGETITALARQYGISRQALSRHLNPKFGQEKRICSSLVQWQRFNKDFQNIELERYKMRMDFMYQNECCTSILVDFQAKEIVVRNQTEDVLHRAFGVRVKPSWEDFEAFLEERCFPRTRDELPLILKDLELDAYDSLAIVEKTQGRMAEDLQWLRLAYYREKIIGQENREEERCRP